MSIFLNPQVIHYLLDTIEPWQKRHALKGQTMKQYEFQIVDKKSQRVEHARATAANPDIARAQIVLMYGSQFDVMGLFCNVNPAHHVVGEIDCSSFPASDFAWLMREAQLVERITSI